MEQVEQIIKYHNKGLENFKNGFVNWIKCGECLLELKKKLSHGKYGEFVDNNLPFNSSQARKYTRIAKNSDKVISLIKEHGSLSIDETTKLLPSADKDQMAYVGSNDGEVKKRNSDDWHTPDDIIDAAKRVMKKIDLDPFSSEEANSRIGAERCFSAEDNALDKNWGSKTTETVFMNPPYGRGMINKTIDKFIEQYELGAFKEAILLVNNATDTMWFHNIVGHATGVCFTKGRISFVSPSSDGILKTVSGNTRGQVLFYFGDNANAFIDEYNDLGWCMEINK